MPRSLSLALVALLSLSACATSQQASDSLGDTAAAATGVTVVGDDAIADFATYIYGETVTSLGARVPAGALVAVAEIRTPADTATGVTGEVVFVQTTTGVSVHYDVRGLTPGDHGFHVHAGASCAPENGAAAGAAGGHFNPTTHPHGARTAGMAMRHVGDFGNITADADGRAEGTFTDDIAMLMGAASVAGHAIIVHGRADDLTSQPSGNADGRVGCGVTELRGTSRN